MVTTSIETERLLIESFSVEHVPEMFQLIQDNETQLTQFGDDTFDKYQRVQDLFDSLKQPKNPLRERYVITTDDNILGSINVEPTGEKSTSYEVGYWLGKEYEGNGFMSEACEAVSNHVLFRAGVRLVSAYTDPENIGSQLVLVRSGFLFSNMAKDQKRYTKTRKT